MGNISYLFKSLYSNKVIIEGRKKPWFFALIFFILGIFLPWIPTLSTGYTSDPSSFISQQVNYEIDKGLTMLTESVGFDAVTIQKNGDGEYYLDMEGLSEATFQESNVNTGLESCQQEYDGTNEKSLGMGFYGEGVRNPDEGKGETFPVSPYITSTGTESGLGFTFYFDAMMINGSEYPSIDPSSGDETQTSDTETTYEDNGNTYFLLAYYIPGLDVASEKGSQYFINFVYSVILDVDKEGSKIENFPHSYIVFAENAFSLVTYPVRSAKTNSYGHSYMNGDFNDAVSLESPASGTSLKAFMTRNGDENDDVIASLRAFFHDGRKQSTIVSAWVTCGILSAVYAGLVLLSSGILIFLAKRKTSAYRDTNYWEAIKESVTLAFTPALLAMIVGFFGGSEMVIGALVLCILMRVIWMNSKICPPTPTDNKPLYQARQ